MEAADKITDDELEAVLRDGRGYGVTFRMGGVRPILVTELNRLTRLRLGERESLASIRHEGFGDAFAGVTVGGRGVVSRAGGDGRFVLASCVCAEGWWGAFPGSGSGLGLPARRRSVQGGLVSRRRGALGGV